MARPRGVHPAHTLDMGSLALASPHVSLVSLSLVIVRCAPSVSVSGYTVLPHL